MSEMTYSTEFADNLAASAFATGAAATAISPSTPARGESAGGLDGGAGLNKKRARAETFSSVHDGSASGVAVSTTEDAHAAGGVMPGTFNATPLAKQLESAQLDDSALGRDRKRPRLTALLSPRAQDAVAWVGLHLSQAATATLALFGRGSRSPSAPLSSAGGRASPDEKRAIGAGKRLRDDGTDGWTLVRTANDPFDGVAAPSPWPISRFAEALARDGGDGADDQQPLPKRHTAGLIETSPSAQQMRAGSTVMSMHARRRSRTLGAAGLVAKSARRKRGLSLVPDAEIEPHWAETRLDSMSAKLTQLIRNGKEALGVPPESWLELDGQQQEDEGVGDASGLSTSLPDLSEVATEDDKSERQTL